MSPSRPSIEPVEFRDVMGRFASGVTVVTTRTSGGQPVGFTASAVASLSLDPVLLLVCVGRTGETLAHLEAAGAFAVNILAADQEDVALRFAGSSRENRFQGLDLEEAGTAAPILDGVLAWLDCTVHDVLDGGDHAIVVGRVQGCRAGEGEPLVYYRGRLGALPW
jgi:3-hydroxy-9,10-secoandrosta-1,3,5(10)-triene-9,17-dione monooxygenase reductase component